MNVKRSLSADAYGCLKLATRRQIKAVGGLEAAASLTRVSKTELGNYQQLRNDRRFIPVDVAADLTLFSGATFILDALAHLANCIVQPIAVGGDDLERDMISFGEYASTTFRDYAAAHGGHESNAHDLERLIHDLGEVVRVAVHAKAAVRGLLNQAASTTRERPNVP